MNKMINEVEQVKYVIKVNGRIVSVSFSSVALAEAAITNLAESDRVLAEIVPVTNTGQEILLG